MKKVLFLMLIIACFSCTKPKETCVPVHLNVVSRQDWVVNQFGNGYWQNTYVDTIVYLEEIGTFKDNAELSSSATQPNAVVGGIKYKDRNGDGVINEADHCK